jgi:hypothetical protein
MTEEMATYLGVSCDHLYRDCSGLSGTTQNTRGELGIGELTGDTVAVDDPIVCRMCYRRYVGYKKYETRKRVTSPKFDESDLTRWRGRWGTVPPILDLVDASGDCWLYAGNSPDKLYPVIVRSERGRKVSYKVARLLWAALVGPIPDDWWLDHMCRNTRCVNPDHMRPMSENDVPIRSDQPSGKRKAQRECKRGHLYTPETIKWQGNKRACAICISEYDTTGRYEQKRRRRMAQKGHRR